MSVVLVAGVASSVPEKHVKEIFGECGKVLAIEPDGPGRFLITYGSDEEVSVAMHLNGINLGGNKVTVSIADPGSAAPVPSAPAPAPAAPTTPLPAEAAMVTQHRADEIARTIYVGNISSGTTADKIKEFFSKVGEVTYVKLAGNPVNAVSYAFVEFRTVNEAQAAKNMNGTSFGDRPIRIGPAQNPIVKTLQTESSSGSGRSSRISGRRRDEIRRKLREAQDYLKRKYNYFNPESEDERRSRKRSRHSRSPSRSPNREREKAAAADKDKNAKKKPANDGMFWDGFQWIPVSAVGPIAQNPAYQQASLKEQLSLRSEVCWCQVEEWLGGETKKLQQSVVECWSRHSLQEARGDLLTLIDRAQTALAQSKAFHSELEKLVEVSSDLLRIEAMIKHISNDIQKLDITYDEYLEMDERQALNDIKMDYESRADPAKRKPLSDLPSPSKDTSGSYKASPSSLSFSSPRKEQTLDEFFADVPKVPGSVSPPGISPTKSPDDWSDILSESKSRPISRSSSFKKLNSEEVTGSKSGSKSKKAKAEDLKDFFD